MKKQIFLLLIIVFLVSFGACGTVQSDSEESESFQKEAIRETSDSMGISKESVSAESDDFASTSKEPEKADSPGRLYHGV